jgi:hypothetical protein
VLLYTLFSPSPLVAKQELDEKEDAEMRRLMTQNGAREKDPNYYWSQSREEVVLSFVVPSETKAKFVEVKLVEDDETVKPKLSYLVTFVESTNLADFHCSFGAGSSL